MDELVRMWAWWLKKNYDVELYPPEMYEDYTPDYIDEWTEALEEEHEHYDSHHEAEELATEESVANIEREYDNNINNEPIFFRGNSEQDIGFL